MLNFNVNNFVLDSNSCLYSGLFISFHSKLGLKKDSVLKAFAVDFAVDGKRGRIFFCQKISRKQITGKDVGMAVVLFTKTFTFFQMIRNATNIKLTFYHEFFGGEW